MPKKTLLQELTESGVDFDTPPASYYSCGLEDPCRIEPDNIIVFFSPARKIQASDKCYHQRYQIKCNLGTSTFLGLDDMRFQIPSGSGSARASQSVVHQKPFRPLMSSSGVWFHTLIIVPVP